MTGIWVLAHEAGHSAFSPQVWVNDVVGWTFHSLLLVPYFSWKYTHASYVLFSTYAHLNRSLERARGGRNFSKKHQKLQLFDMPLLSVAAPHALH